MGVVSEFIRATPGVLMQVGSTTVKSTSGRIWAISVIGATTDTVAEVHNTTDGSGASKFSIKAGGTGPGQSISFPQGMFMDTAISIKVTGDGSAYVVFD